MTLIAHLCHYNVSVCFTSVSEGIMYVIIFFFIVSFQKDEILF